MSARPKSSRPIPERPTGPLDPALLRLIEAMARADVERDFMAAAGAGGLPAKGR